MAERSTHVEIANYLRGISNEKYKNSLFYAAKKGDLAKAKNILEKAGSNAYELVKKQDEGCKFTALHYAAQYGHLEMAKLLLKYKAPLDVKGISSFTPLITACFYRNERMALFLLDYDVNPNTVISGGCGVSETAFSLAVSYSMLEVIKKMWDKGNVNPKARAYMFFMQPTIFQP